MKKFSFEKYMIANVGNEYALYSVNDDYFNKVDKPPDYDGKTNITLLRRKFSNGVSS